MGQHKHNPTAIKARAGELPPKPPKMSKRELQALTFAAMMAKVPSTMGIMATLGMNSKGGYNE